MIVLSDTQIANIVFNETRSLDGPAIREARIDVAHAIINAAASPHRFPKMAPSRAKVGPGEQAIYSDCVRAVAQARLEAAQGKDPTGGATHFNFRKNAFAGSFQGYALKTSSGPLTNSFPTTALPGDGVYANTYE